MSRPPAKSKPSKTPRKRRPAIPDKTVLHLWLAAGGRCQFEGCNEALWRDNLTMDRMNRAYIAHIRDVNPKTHRYDPIESPRLEKDFTNLMLMCDTHHRKIDGPDERQFTISRLQAMKAQHEQRIELLTSIKEENKSHVLFYGANIGEQSPVLRFERAAWAMVPHRYPAEPRGIELSLQNSARKDDDPRFWNSERENLRASFSRDVAGRLRSGEIGHLSIFALGPMPLLMELGRLLTDITPADCYELRNADAYQLHREPPDWKWQSHPSGFEYIVSEPAEVRTNVALVFSLSATVDDSRIRAVLGEDVSIWKLTVPNPNNDYLKSREQLALFRQHTRVLLDRIKARHGVAATLHVFPAMPVSTALDFGRIWMPKADLTLQIWDENRKLGGFQPVLTFDRQPSGGTP